MDKIIAVLSLIFSCLLISSSSLQFKPTTRQEKLQQFVKLTLPFLKQHFMSRQDIDSLYKILGLNSEDKPNGIEEKKTTKKVDRDDEAFENVKRKLDDYGHLRFGRNEDTTKSEISSYSGERLKYNDPDYGHMRFG